MLLTNIYPFWGRLKWPYAIARLTAHFYVWPDVWSGDLLLYDTFIKNYNAPERHLPAYMYSGCVAISSRITSPMLIRWALSKDIYDTHMTICVPAVPWKQIISLTPLMDYDYIMHSWHLYDQHGPSQMIMQIVYLKVLRYTSQSGVSHPQFLLQILEFTRVLVCRIQPLCPLQKRKLNVANKTSFRTPWTSHNCLEWVDLWSGHLLWIHKHLVLHILTHALSLPIYSWSWSLPGTYSLQAGDPSAKPKCQAGLPGDPWSGHDNIPGA